MRILPGEDVQPVFSLNLILLEASKAISFFLASVMMASVNEWSWNFGISLHISVRNFHKVFLIMKQIGLIV